MTDEKLLKRIEMCEKDNLCFLSLDKLDNELFVTVVEFYLNSSSMFLVKVKSIYSK